MNKFLAKLAKSKTGTSSGAVVGIVVSVVIVTALIPVIADRVAGATNLSASETTILQLSTTFIVLGLIVLIAKKTGLLHM